MSGVRSFFKDLGQYFKNSAENVSLGQEDRLRLSGKGLRVAVQNTGFAVEMGKQTVHICPDRSPAIAEAEAACDYILFDPELYFSSIAHSIRLKPGETLKIDHRLDYQNLVFKKPKHAFRRHLQIKHEGDFLVFSDPISELGTYLKRIEEPATESRLEKFRQAKLAHLREIYGGPLVALPADEALKTIQAVNQVLKTDAYRQVDSFDNAGALLELPPYLTPIIVGDLHAQVDNLLTLLCCSTFLDALERGEAALILLGDAIHREAEAELSDMDSSVLIMDLIFKLKLRFPRHVFFMVGNHDSFSPDVMKGGVPQSVLWERMVLKQRGEDYRREMALFYRQSPLVVLTEDFLACHAGPPRSRVTRDKLVEARQFTDLVHELTWNRIKSNNWPLGYTRTDVKRFRKSLEVDDELPFIVAHYPQNKDDTLWLDIDQVANHHILFSARPDRVAVFTRVKGEMVPQIYPTQALKPLLEIS